MNERDKTVFLDEEIEPRILAIIREAEKYVVIVSPYLDLWGHAQAAIESAVKKGTKVTVIIRSDQEFDEEKKDSILWLLSNDVELLFVENLHAKIYMNEHDLIISSMNIWESSTNNNLEIALLVSNEYEKQQLRDYVNNRVMGIATSQKEAIANLMSQQFGGQRAAAVSRPGTGFCIRCGQPRHFDLSKPLCDGCYKSWAEHPNENHEEKFCLRCGRPAEVTKARPLCGSCYYSGQR